MGKFRIGATGIGRREMKIKTFISGGTSIAKTAKRLFICLDNGGYEVCLERLKIYLALQDAEPARTGYLRILDESGENDLYSSQRFIAADLPLLPNSGDSRGRITMHAINAKFTAEIAACASGSARTGLLCIVCLIA